MYLPFSEGREGLSNIVYGLFVICEFPFELDFKLWLKELENVISVTRFLCFLRILSAPQAPFPFLSISKN